MALLFVLFLPPFQPDPRDSHECSSHDLLGRLGREESSLAYQHSLSFSLFFLSLFLLSLFLSLAFRLSASLSRRRNHLSSRSIAPTAGKDRNIDKSACRRRHLGDAASCDLLRVRDRREGNSCDPLRTFPRRSIDPLLLPRTRKSVRRIKVSR